MLVTVHFISAVNINFTPAAGPPRPLEDPHKEKCLGGSRHVARDGRTHKKAKHQHGPAQQMRPPLLRVKWSREELDALECGDEATGSQCVPETCEWL